MELSCNPFPSCYHSENREKRRWECEHEATALLVGDGASLKASLGTFKVSKWRERALYLPKTPRARMMAREPARVIIVGGHTASTVDLLGDGAHFPPSLASTSLFRANLDAEELLPTRQPFLVNCLAVPPGMPATGKRGHQEAGRPSCRPWASA